MGRVLSRGAVHRSKMCVSCRDQVLQRSLQLPVCGEKEQTSQSRPDSGLGLSHFSYELLYKLASCFLLARQRCGGYYSQVSRYKTRRDFRLLLEPLYFYHRSEPLRLVRLQAFGAKELWEAHIIVLGGHLVAHEAVVAAPLLLRVHHLLVGGGLGLRRRLLRLQVMSSAQVIVHAFWVASEQSFGWNHSQSHRRLPCGCERPVRSGKKQQHSAESGTMRRLRVAFSARRATQGLMGRRKVGGPTRHNHY